MKDKILKHTGLTEKQFYAKYKTQADFENSPEGKSFKKAQGGFGFKMPGMMNATSLNQPEDAPLPNMQQYLPSGINKGNPKTPVDTGTGDTNRNNIPDYLEGAEAPVNTTFGPKNSPQPIPEKKGFDMNALPGMVGEAAGAVSSWFNEKAEAKKAKMWHGVTDVQLAASRTKPERSEQKYVRGEDQIVSDNQLNKQQGVGTNILTQNGGRIPMMAEEFLNNYNQGNPGEISNTYAPNDIYTDSGYEPLNDSDLKRYAGGGFMDIASSFAPQATSAASTMFSQGGEGPNAGFQTGKLIGDVAGKFIPIPGVDKLAGLAGGLIGGAFDKFIGPAGDIASEQKATQRNIDQMQGSQMAASVQAGNASYQQNGGFVPSHGNPQLVKYFGNHSMTELLKPDPMMDTLQDGGYAGGGEIQSLWGGEVYPDSYNPYMDGSGITYNTRGQSHHESDGKGRTGIGISVMDSGGGMPSEVNVEAERREPIATIGDTKMVMGNLYANLSGDPEDNGKRIKNIYTDLNKKENKHNKELAENTKTLADPDLTPIQRKTAELIDLGNTMSLERIADKKKDLAHLQTAINETRDEMSKRDGVMYSAEQLSKNGSLVKDRDSITNKSMAARHGAILDIAQGGRKFTSEKDAIAAGFKKNDKGSWVKAGTQGTKKITKAEKADALDYARKGQHRKDTGLYGEVTPEQFDKTKAANPWFDWKGFDPGNPEHTDRFQKAFNEKAKSIGSAARIKNDKLFGEQTASARLDLAQAAEETPPTEESAVVEAQAQPVEDKKANWWNALSAAVPYIRPSNAMALDPNQLMGEMSALSQNQVEPVRAQGFQPRLLSSQDQSAQEQRNAIIQQTRAAQRMAGYNPAAQAQIAAQAYQPLTEVNANEFRMNQAEKERIYGSNIGTMNEADRFNLGQYKEQADKINQAVSNTKQVQQQALSSIADKYQRNKLENKELQTWENMYNYRYGPGMRAMNMNAPAQFNIPNVYQGENENDALDYRDYAEYKKAKKAAKADEAKTAKETAVTRNGSIVKALKRM